MQEENMPGHWVDKPTPADKSLKSEEPIKTIKEITAEEHCKAFLTFLRRKDILMSDAKKYLTLTNQEDCKYVGRSSVEGAINGLHALLQTCMVVWVKEKIVNPSPLLSTVEFKVSNIKKESIMQCTLVKEFDIRHPAKNGVWGINAFSFKLK